MESQKQQMNRPLENSKARKLWTPNLSFSHETAFNISSVQKPCSFQVSHLRQAQMGQMLQPPDVGDASSGLSKDTSATAIGELQHHSSPLRPCPKATTHSCRKGLIRFHVVTKNKRLHLNLELTLGCGLSHLVKQLRLL